MDISYPIRFWLYFIFIIPSILCGIFDLYHFLGNRALRKAMNNHMIIVVLGLGLFYNVTDIVWFMHHYRTGAPLSATLNFCRIWVYIDYAPFVSILILVAWASIERHILIFHQNWLTTRTQRLLLHYLPLIVFTIYPFVYYIITIFVLPCDVPANYEEVRCLLDNCLYVNVFLGMWDNIVHNTIPIFTISIFSIALLARVWYSKYRIRQRFQWRNYRKMTIQLVSLSAVYFVIYFPTIIMYTAYIGGVSFDGMVDFFSIGYYFCYFVILLTPFVCALSLPELREKLQKMIHICHRKRRIVGPEILMLNRLAAGGGLAESIPVVG